MDFKGELITTTEKRFIYTFTAKDIIHWLSHTGEHVPENAELWASDEDGTRYDGDYMTFELRGTELSSDSAPFRPKPLLSDIGEYEIGQFHAKNIAESHSLQSSDNMDEPFDDSRMHQ